MSSIIFIGSPQSSRKSSTKEALKELFVIPPYTILVRIFVSFVPPVGKQFRTISVDFLGPILGFIFLSAILNYGYASKPNQVWMGPTEFLLMYTLIVPIVYYSIIALAHSTVSLIELLSLIGYTYYGHIFTLVVSYVCYHETSNLFFYLCLFLFGGSSTFRLVLVLLKTISFPGARLVVCSFIGIVQILTLMFFHFAYMHRTFVYGKNIN